MNKIKVTNKMDDTNKNGEARTADILSAADDLSDRRYYDTPIGPVCMSKYEYERYLEKKVNIRKATENDLPHMMEIYAIARKFMVESGNPRQWAARNWPPEELIRSDIAAGHSYVCEADGRITAVFYFNYGHAIDRTYDVIEDGAWIGNEDYGVVHRIAADGTVKGAGAFCINWAIDQCGHVRMDTHGDNKPMQHVLEKIGFTKCGIIHVVEDNDPRLAFEIIR